MFYRGILLPIILSASLFSGSAVARDQWTPEQAHDWYDQQPWIVGANFTPSTAVNQIEMWHPDTFDPETIDKELGYAAAAGINTMRVFVHTLVWENHAACYKKRLKQLLDISDKHTFKTLFVLFDSDWDPNPVYGKQKDPVPGVHNSRWVQGPGEARLQDESQYHKLQEYVQGVVGMLANDSRVLGWDLWNEPSNPGGGVYENIPAAEKEKYLVTLLPQVYEWARSANPTQPLTAGLWIGDDWSDRDKQGAIERIQLNESDVISFHDYGWPESFAARVEQLKGYGRPLIATEYMARGTGSTIDGTMPLGKEYNVGMINWGLVDGKIQTRLPWDSWFHPYTDQQPVIWFHDVFQSDGTPYRQAEIDLIKRLSAAPKGEAHLAGQ